MNFATAFREIYETEERQCLENAAGVAEHWRCVVFSKRVRLSLIAALTFGLAGCEVNERGHFNNAQTAQVQSAATQVRPETVQLVEGAPKVLFTPIREISVTVSKITMFHANPDEQAVRRALQAEAARLGANAVLNVEVSGLKVTPISWGARTGRGLAVRF